MHGDAEQELEEARERLLWGRVALALWTSLIILADVALLWILIAVLGWQPYLVLCILGALAGVAIAAALAGSRGSSATAGLVIGGVVLPLCAAYLSGLAARSPEALSAGSAALLPFIACATVSFLGAWCISALWRRRPAPPPPEIGTAHEPATSLEGTPR